MKYRKIITHYNYRLAKDFIIQTDIIGYNIDIGFILLLPKGKLIIKKEYAWDGATCFPDYDWIMTPSLVHDALYQLISMDLLGMKHRKYIDKLLMGLSKERDGNFLPNVVYRGVRIGGRMSIKLDRTDRTIYEVK